MNDELIRELDLSKREIELWKNKYSYSIDSNDCYKLHLDKYFDEINYYKEDDYNHYTTYRNKEDRNIHIIIWDNKSYGFGWESEIFIFGVNKNLNEYINECDTRYNREKYKHIFELIESSKSH